MKTKYKWGLGLVLIAAVIAVTVWYLRKYPIAVLQPAGVIAGKQRALLIFAASLSLAIVVPVFGLLGYFAWKYREGNKKAKYTPSLGGSKLAETIWWVVPSVLIIVIATLTWQSSYALDPYKVVAANQPVLHIQVVALDWKWLFIYPAQHVAAVNELTIPQNVPVDFEITSDSVMNSFWIPNLGGQMYAMPGMTTQLNLLATKLGTYRGGAANISGQGFADMNFPVHVIQAGLYSQWAQAMRIGNGPLNNTSYGKLAKPGTLPAGTLQRYGSIDSSLFDNIIMKYMMPMNANMDDGGNHMNSKMDMNGMQM